MTPGLGLALGAMLCFGVADLIYKRAAAAGISAGEYSMLQPWTFCPCITLYAWLTGTLDLHASALWGSLAGFFLLIAVYNFVRSLQGGAVSTNAPIFRLNFTITAALAILFLGETLTVTKALALACALIAVWLLLAEAGMERGKFQWTSVIRVVIATVAMALVNFFYKVGLQHGALPETLIFAQGWTFGPLALLVPLYQEGRLNITPGAWRYAVSAALALLTAFILLSHGLVVGAASVLVPVAQMSFVFTALLGVAIFRERLDLRKCTGLAVAVVALGLFAIS
jgi:uncharacterized membrane protein